MNLRCLNHQEIQGYREGLYPPSLARKVQAHLQTCVACQQKMARLERPLDSMEAILDRNRDVLLAHANCLDDELLLALVEGAEHLEAQRHLAECSFCQNRLEETRIGWEAWMADADA